MYLSFRKIPTTDNTVGTKITVNFGENISKRFDIFKLAPLRNAIAIPKRVIHTKKFTMISSVNAKLL